ncbi:MAG: hypothetical protein K8R11_07200 [Methanococcoides sp.]|nr:hypothetical protein [Methanococcoides sp.]
MKYRTKKQIKSYAIIGIIFFAGMFIGTAYGNDIKQIITDLDMPQMDYPNNKKYSVEVISVKEDSFRTAFGSEDIDDVKIKITNNGDDSIKLSLKKHGIVYDDSHQQGILTTTMSISVPNKYLDWDDPEYYGYFTLFPGGSTTLDLAFSKIDKTSDPKLVLSFIENPDVEITDVGTLIPNIDISGHEDEYIIPLEPYFYKF